MRWLTTILAVVLLCSAQGNAEESRPALVGGASMSHAWVFVSESESRGWLLHLANEWEPGVAEAIRGVTSPPEAIGADGNGLLIVFPAGVESEGDGRSTRPVRSFVVLPGEEEGTFRIARESLLPALPARGAVASIARVGGKWHALMSGPPARGASSDSTTLLREGEQAWEPVDLPRGVRNSHWNSMAIGRQGGRLVFAAVDADGLVLAARRSTNGVWTSRTIEAPGPGELVYGEEGRLILIARVGPTEHRLWILRSEVFAPLGTISTEANEVTALPMRDRIECVWRDPLANGRILSESLGWTGSVLSPASPVSLEPPLSARHLEALVVILISVVVSIGVFVFQPAVHDPPPSLPEGTALAGPGRRMGAFALDFIPAVAIASLVWRLEFWEVLDPARILHSPQGIWPLLTSLVLFAVLGALSEAFWGTTPGKWATGCRVADPGGGKPAVGRSLGRWFLKTTCPLIALHGVLNPGRRDPVSLGVLVLIDLEDQPSGPGPQDRPDR